MRYSLVFATALAFFCGYMAHSALNVPEPLKIEGTTWCLAGEFRTLKDYQDETPLPYSMIDVYPGGVRVYERCDP